MELDDFKNSNLKKKEDVIETSLNHNSRTDKFIELFKIEIKNQKKRSLKWMSFLLLLGVIYISVSVKMDSLTRTGYHLCVIGFILGALYVYFRYRALPDSFYTMPVSDFIDKVEMNLKFMKLSDWLIVLPLLLILGTGGGMIFITRLLQYTDDFITLLLIWIMFFVSVTIFGFYASKKNWKKEYESLFEEFQKFKESFLNNGKQV
jgi:hypothetical protein